MSVSIWNPSRLPIWCVIGLVELYNKSSAHRLFQNQFAPHDETVDTVLNWLQDAGHAVKKHSNYIHTKGAVIVKLSVEEMEELCGS